MVYIKNGKKFLSRKEIEENLDNYIEKTADEMIFEINKKRKNKKIIVNEFNYV